MERFVSLVLGLALIAVWVWIVVKLVRGAKKIDRERFERTNASGVLEFDSYDEKVRFERREGLNTALQRIMGGAGFIGFLIGLVLVAVAIFGE
ncbi:hypothetical protein Brsp07_04553 [Brucella sp. NBRC 14130]|uniref:hypothetical protein n=1 Tax=Brucella sp. NBRC 14130 TaxID=3075483 RepID=UPI003094D93B